MTDKPRKTLQEQLRTLDEASREPDPIPPSGPYPIVSKPRNPYRLPTGYWCMDIDKHPNLWRRFWAWALLGYVWHPYRE
jgi:hypothetical protein